MSAELSQRLALIMHKVTAELDIDGRERFVKRASKANSFEDLSKKDQRLIIKLEEQ